MKVCHVQHALETLQNIWLWVLAWKEVGKEWSLPLLSKQPCLLHIPYTATGTVLECSIASSVRCGWTSHAHTEPQPVVQGLLGTCSFTVGKMIKLLLQITAAILFSVRSWVRAHFWCEDKQRAVSKYSENIFIYWRVLTWLTQWDKCLAVILPNLEKSVSLAGIQSNGKNNKFSLFQEGKQSENLTGFVWEEY